MYFLENPTSWEIFPTFQELSGLGMFKETKDNLIKEWNTTQHVTKGEGVRH